MLYDIKKRRKELSLTLEDIGKQVGVGKSTVKKWECGQIHNMKRDKIGLLAKTLKISPLELLGIPDVSNSELNLLDNSKIRNIPVYSSVSAGFGVAATNIVEEYTPLYIESEFEARETICIRVVGDSMFPKIENGDLIQVHKQLSVDSGDVAVVLIDGEEGLVKKVVYDKDKIELHSFNPIYQTMIFADEQVTRINVVGKVVKIIKSL